MFYIQFVRASGQKIGATILLTVIPLTCPMRGAGLYIAYKTTAKWTQDCYQLLQTPVENPLNKNIESVGGQNPLLNRAF